MRIERIENIKNNIREVDNLPNLELIEMMDFLSLEFDETKQSIIDMTYYIDEVEMLYNKVLNEYQKRTV